MPQPTVWLGLGRVVDPSTWTKLAALVMKQCWEIALPIQLVFMTVLTLKMLELAAKVSDLHLHVVTYLSTNANSLQCVLMETSGLLMVPHSMKVE